MSLTIRCVDNKKFLVPEGLHVARCFALIDLGLQLNKEYGTYSPKIMIGWELSQHKNGEPYVHWQQFTARLNPCSKLRKLVASWLGGSLMLDEFPNFSLENLLGMPCRLTIKYTFSARKNFTWADIVDIRPLPFNIPCPALSQPIIYFDLDYYMDEQYRNLPQFIQKKINFSGNNRSK